MVRLIPSAHESNVQRGDSCYWRVMEERNAYIVVTISHEHENKAES